MKKIFMFKSITSAIMLISIFTSSSSMSASASQPNPLPIDEAVNGVWDVVASNPTNPEARKQCYNALIDCKKVSDFLMKNGNPDKVSNELMSKYASCLNLMHQVILDPNSLVNVLIPENLDIFKGDDRTLTEEKITADVQNYSKDLGDLGNRTDKLNSELSPVSERIQQMCGYNNP